MVRSLFKYLIQQINTNSYLGEFFDPFTSPYAQILSLEEDDDGMISLWLNVTNVLFSLALFSITYSWHKVAFE